MKTTKGGKVMNPTDAYRKELRKKELKRNKKERKRVREVGILKKDPDAIREQIQKLESMKAEGALDKARKHKKRQLEDTLNLVLKKRKEYEEKMKEKGETPVMFSHLGPPRRRTTAEEEERSKHPKPEDSVYYHPTLNPTGAPPPGKPPMYKSSIGPRIPLTAASSSGAPSSSNPEGSDASLDVLPPPPPPPPPLPDGAITSSESASVLPSSLPLPPTPPMPSMPPTADMGIPVPLPPLPPPPPGPPPKDQVAIRPPLPPQPPLPPSAPPAPPGIGGSEKERSEEQSFKEPAKATPTNSLPPPPPPPGMPPESTGKGPEGDASEPNVNHSTGNELPEVAPPPPLPPRQQPPVPAPPTMLPTLQPDVPPPGMSRFPPPPPPLPAAGLPGQVAPPAVMVPLTPRPPYGLPPGPPPMMRPPLPPGPPPSLREDAHTENMPLPPQKPSYVKSAAPTVVKRPLAQHTPELTSMVPASVRVKREAAIPKPKPKSSGSALATTSQPVPPAVSKPDASNSSAGTKPQSIDDSYMAFLEDMKALGALDG